MLGLPVTLTLPEVVGCELTGSSNAFVTSIDIVLGITKVSSNYSCSMTYLVNIFYVSGAAPQEIFGIGIYASILSSHIACIIKLP